MLDLGEGEGGLDEVVELRHVEPRGRLGNPTMIAKIARIQSGMVMAGPTRAGAVAAVLLRR